MVQIAFYILGSFFLLTMPGCALIGLDPPTGAKPVMESRIKMFKDLKRSGIDPICVLYRQHGLLDEVSTDTKCYAICPKENQACKPYDWKVKLTATNEVEEQDLIKKRNELQHQLLGLATTNCDIFKKELVSRATRNTMTFESLSLLLSAGGSVSSGASTTNSLSASSGAFNAIGGLYEEHFVNNFDLIASGIEMARTNVFRQILRSRDKNLVDYPISRAVNDAFRYDAMCNIADGMVAASAAVKDQIQNRSEGSNDIGSGATHLDGDSNTVGSQQD